MACIALESIMSGGLMLNSDFDGIERQYLDRLRPDFLHKKRRDFLAAIAGWSSKIVLEVRIAFTPNLLYKTQSYINICLVLRTAANDIVKVRESIYAGYLALLPLLQTYWSEAEFVPVTDQKEFAQYQIPDDFRHAMSVCRKRENVELTAPYPGIGRIGFGAGIEKTEKKPLTALHFFPWLASGSEWSDLLSAMLGQLDPLQLIVRIRPWRMGAATARRLTDTIRKCETFLSDADPGQITINRQAESLRHVCTEQLASLKNGGFRLGVFLLSSAPIDSSLGRVLGGAITRTSLKEKADILRGGFELRKINTEQAGKITFFSESEGVTIDEAACCFRLPSPPVGTSTGLSIKRHRTALGMLPKVSFRQQDSQVTLFDNVHQGISQPVRIGLSDRFRHMFILGQTGTGKSTFMESLVLQDIRAGRGVGVIDPHGELVDSIIGKIPEQRIEDVILFDLLDTEYPIGFNLLQWWDLKERDLLIDELYTSIDRIYDMRTTGGPIFEHNFRGMLGLLMGNKPRENFTATILEFISCYQNEEFRSWLADTTDDNHALEFVEELETSRGDVSIQNLSPYITSKFSRFINDTTIRRIVGQSHTSFYFDDIMNNRKIFLIKLGKGRYGANMSALIANQLVSRFKLAAMKRGEMAPEEREPFFLYVDEAHNLPRENFMELLSEARKYKLGLVLATQYLAQLTGTTSQDDLLGAITGNVGTTLTFRLGQADAASLAPTLAPVFGAIDIAGLPNFQGYARMQLNNEATRPFSFMTKVDDCRFDSRIAAKIIEQSRRKYATKAEEVDRDIEARRTVWES